MNSVSPVFTEKEMEVERVIALDQPEYIPLIVLPIIYEDGIQASVVRFRLTEEERIAILDGADIILTQLTFGGAFKPIHITTCSPNKSPY